MAWITPKTDWQPTDPLTHNDYNRIKNNLIFLNDIFNELFGEYDFDPGEDMEIDQLFKASTWNMFEDCVEHFQRSGIIHTFGERSYYENNGRLPNYIQLNRLEQCILEYSNYDNPVTGVSVESSYTYSINGWEGQQFPYERVHQLTAVITPSNASNKRISWTSSDPDVVEVDSEGYLTFKKGGSAVITVTTADGGFTASCDAYMLILGKLYDANIEVVVGDVYNFYENNPVDPSNANFIDRYYFPSWDNEYVKLEDGILTAKSAKNGLVFTERLYQVTDTEYMTYATYHIDIIAASVSVTGITLDESSLRLNKNTTQQLVATVLPADATNKNVIWSSSNTSIATVSSTGLVTTKSVTGSVTITARTEDGNFTATCEIVVQTITEGSYYENIPLDFMLIDKTKNSTLTLISKYAIYNYENVSGGITYGGTNGIYEAYSNAGVTYSSVDSNVRLLLNSLYNNNISATMKNVLNRPTTNIFSFIYYYETNVRALSAYTRDYLIEPNVTELGGAASLANSLLDAASQSAYPYFVDNPSQLMANDIRHKTTPALYFTRTIDPNRKKVYIVDNHNAIGEYSQESSVAVRPLIFLKTATKVYPTPTSDGAYVIDYDSLSTSIRISDLPLGSVIRDVPYDEAFPS